MIATLSYLITGLVVLLPASAPASSSGFILGLEIFFLSLLALASIAIAWIAGVVVFKLYKGQR
ncbi:hypothetical protein [Leucobacter sp. OH1287]|uniref:hypothetical protein n=1 Tax=Leucobacter sp. OH1287 TaxID=2491049 RepID=UPI000F5FEFE8|nr:hypothetical protein [Leucobacter sp. OH1287]RRD60713.1 hypothetical protein EII30_05545 [Leucobacter sp. OH1287]